VTAAGAPMRPILMPARAIARSADWAPGPGVFVLLPPVARSLMCTAPMPSSCAANQASDASLLAGAQTRTAAGIHSLTAGKKKNANK
jgi:hypothetical protein